MDLQEGKKKKELQVFHNPQKYAPPKKKPVIWPHSAGANELGAKVALRGPERWPSMSSNEKDAKLLAVG